MYLRARKPIFILLATLVLMTLAVACTTLSMSSSQPVLPGAQESTPEPTSTSEPATVILGSGIRHLSPELWSLLYQQLAGTTVPERVSVLIIENAADTTQSLSDYITAAGGSSSGNMIWELPSSLLPSLVLRPDVSKMWLQTTRTTRDVSTDPYPTLGLNDTLDDVAEAYAADVPAEQAVLYAFVSKDGRVLVKVTASGATTETAIRTWLTTHNIFLHPQTQSGARDTLYIKVVLPVAQILPLAQAFPSTPMQADGLPGPGITLSRDHWDDDVVEIAHAPVDWWSTPLVSEGPIGAAGCPTSPLGGVSTWKTDLASRQTLHGVVPWHSAGIDGTGVKVGIIDWGFYGYGDSPSLCNLTTTTDKTTVGGTYNAFCQDIGEATLPDSYLVFGSDCEPNIARFIGVDHGVNIAELVVDMAPGVELFLAQANSPRQVKAAADWLVAQGVDVIVHASGWLFDGKGDGTSPLLRTNAPAVPSVRNSHSAYRYYPGVLNTVDEIIKGTGGVAPTPGAPLTPDNGPIWINAAGNQQHLTMYTKDVSLAGNGDFAGYMVFHPLAVTPYGKTCQRIPQNALHLYSSSLRWGDAWPTATNDLDFIIAPLGTNPTSAQLDDVHVSTSVMPQLPREYAVRRAAYNNFTNNNSDVCLFHRQPGGKRSHPSHLGSVSNIGRRRAILRDRA